MSRFLSVLTVLLVFPVVGHSQTLSPAQKMLLSRLTGEWKSSFRSIHSLDLRWEMSGNFPEGAGGEQTIRYHFTVDRWRNRYDTTFYVTKPSPSHIRNHSVLVAGGFLKSLHIYNNGDAELGAQPASPKDRHLRNRVIPLLGVFSWAQEDQSRFTRESKLTLEALGGDSFWQRFARRVQNISPGTWEGRSGWWLDVNHAPRLTGQARVFVDNISYFPYFWKGKGNFEYEDPEESYEVRVTQTQKWMAAGKTRLMPLRITWRSWSHDLDTGERDTTTLTEQVTAPIQVNKLIAPPRWQLSIPAKTRVSFQRHAALQMREYTSFEFDPRGGSLWAQARASRQSRLATQSQLAAKRIYDEKADGEAQIADALRLAQSQNKNVLLQFGASWCAPCHVLHDLLKNDAALAPLVKDNYIAVSIDVDKGHNEAVVKRLRGSGQGGGIPFMVVLASDGRRLAAPPTRYFASKKSQEAFDTEKLAAFLGRWKPKEELEAFDSS